MKILILDIYPDSKYRISKDTNGGYGTANRYGDGLIAKLLAYLMSKGADWPPIYSMYVLSILREKGHTADYSRTLEKIEQYDLVLLTSSIVCHETELKTIKYIKKLGIPVGVIGPFASTMPHKFTKEGAFVISGQPEAFFLNNDPSEIDLFGSAGVINGFQSANLDNLPLPAWDVIIKNDALKFNLLSRKEKMIPIIATQGCPYSCYEYCTYPLQQGRKVRYRSPDKIVSEMVYWQESYGVTLFIFRDPVFSLNRKHSFQLCNEIMKSGRKFRFIVETHINNLDNELAKHLLDSGMVMAKIGIESITEKSLIESKRKSINPVEQMLRIKDIEKLGVHFTCHYIICMPGESKETFWKTMNYAKKLNTLFIQISVFTPYPGTRIFESYKNRIIVDKYEDFTQFDLVFNNGEFTKKETKRIMSKAYMQYFMRPTWIIKYLRMRSSGIFGV